jgi:iron complex outermembrane receptor protein
VSVYNEELIEDQRAFTLKEVLKNDPSIAVQMPGGFYGTQNFALRGFQVDNFNGYRIDGLPMIQTVAPYLDDKARVELLKGPAALRFGFMPPGGAINLVRKHPTQELSTSLQFDIDTFGSLYSQLDVSDTVAGGKFGYRLVLAGDEFDSFYDNAGGDRRMASLFTEWRPVEEVTIWTAIGGQDLSRNGYYGPMITANGRVLDTGRKTNIMQDWARNDQEMFDAAIGMDIKLGENWKLRTSFNYQDTERYSQLSYPYSVLDNGDFTDGALLTNGPFEWESWGAHLHLEGHFNTGSLRHNVVVGGQYRAYESYGERSFPDVGPNNAYQLNSLPVPAPGPWRVLHFEYDELGTFVTDTIEFNDQWSVLLGGRYGKFDNTNPTDPASDDTVEAWTPTVALMFAPMENVNTYFTYTRGVQDGGFARRTAANAFAPLGKQESEQLELGVKSEWFDGRLAGELALFQIEQDLAMMDPASGIESFAGLQRHRGIEFALRGKVTENLQAGFAAMFLDAEQKETGIDAFDGKRPQYVPEYQVNLWAVLDIPQVPGLSLNANARFVDKQYLDQGEAFATDSYTVVDVGARYKFKTANADWTVRLGVQNMLDERFYESGEFYPGDAGYLAYGSPVSAVLSLQVEF